MKCRKGCRLSGTPVEPVQLESVTADKFLSRYKLLLLTFEGQKPLKPAYNEALAHWVRGGGALLVVDNDQDPYNAVREWWNAAPNSYRTPREHLFKTLGLRPEQTGLHKVGKGAVIYENSSPAALSYQNDGAEKVKKLVQQLDAAVHLAWKDSSALVLKRGPYVVAAALKDEVKLPDATSISSTTSWPPRTALLCPRVVGRFFTRFHRHPALQSLRPHLAFKM